MKGVSKKNKSVRDWVVCWKHTPEYIREYPYTNMPKVMLRHRSTIAPRLSDHDSFAGACDIGVREASDKERRRYCMQLALHLIITVGIKPAEVHRGLRPLREYRASLFDGTQPPPEVDEYLQIHEAHEDRDDEYEESDT